MGAQDELWTSKRRLARRAVLLTALTVHKTIPLKIGQRLGAMLLITVLLGLLGTLLCLKQQ